MKKILAIAIALVMVFAIASTAFAAIGFPAAALPKTGVTVDVIGLTATTGVFQSAPSTYLKYDQTKGVVATTPVTFLVSLSTARGTAATTFDPAANSATLRVAATNLAASANAAVTSFVNNAAGDVLNAAAAGAATPAVTMGLPAAPAALNADLYRDYAITPAGAVNNAYGVTNYLLFTGYSVAKTKDATITVTWKGVTEKFSATTNPANTITIKNAAGKSYTVAKANVTTTNADYTVTIPTGDNANGSVMFRGNKFDGANYNAYSVEVTGASGTNLAGYTAGINISTGTVDFKLGNADWISTTNPTGYAALKSVLDEVCAIFGWVFDGTLGLKLNDAGFEAYAGSAATQKATWTYYAYTDALTVAGAAAVPDTGDMSIVGIALVVVATIATAAIVIKKVRA